jgi:hypothetical protein
MDVQELTKALQDIEKKYTVLEREETREVENKLEQKRKELSVGGEFKLGEKSDFNRILTTQSPEQIIRKMKLNNIPKQTLNIQYAFENSPRQLWPQLSQFEKELNKADEIPQKNNGIKYLSNRFNNAVNNLLNVADHKARVWLDKKYAEDNRVFKEAMAGYTG